MLASSCICIVLIWCGLESFSYVTCDELLKAKEVEHHIQLGKELLSQGHYEDALSHFHAAVDFDSQNYLTYYTRATTYLAVGKIIAGLKDLSRVIELKPDFFSARLQRANLFLKQGRLDEAHIDYEYLLRIDPANQDANHGYQIIEPLRRDVQVAYAMLADHNYHDVIDLLSRLLEELTWDTKLREMRSQAYESIGDLTSAISDLRSIVRFHSENQMFHLRLSELHYTLGDVGEALDSIRECLRYDPDHKACFTYYKHVKKMSTHIKATEEAFNNGHFQECAERCERALVLEIHASAVRHLLFSRLCICLNKANRPEDAIKSCDDALILQPNDLESLCEKADAHINLQKFEEAIRLYHKALEIDDSSRKARDGLHRAQKLEKQSKKRNYYAILGVNKFTSKKDILKAYRKLAQKFHPDNFQGDEKKEAEQKFIDIAAAKEVLTDPGKKQKFDNGEDPLDPENQQGGFNPFEHFDRSFKFKFDFR